MGLCRLGVVAFGVFFSIQSAALAFEGETAVGGGLAYFGMDWGGAMHHGFGATATVRYSLADEWRLGGFTAYGAGFRSHGVVDALAAGVDVVYVLDVTKWVPGVGVGVAYLEGLASDVEPDVALLAHASLEYRRFREFGVGVEGLYLFGVRNRFASVGTFLASLYVAFYLR